jgi:hypothetical protein
MGMRWVVENEVWNWERLLRLLLGERRSRRRCCRGRR